jgi:hypothetical protein
MKLFDPDIVLSTRPMMHRRSAGTADQPPASKRGRIAVAAGRQPGDEL